MFLNPIFCAEAGDLEAMIYLAERYELGVVFERNLTEAIKLYRQAAKGAKEATAALEQLGEEL